MTALGLVVAVPAVLAYNWLIRRNKSIMEDLAAFTNDLHGYLMSDGAVKPRLGGATGPARQGQRADQERRRSDAAGQRAASHRPHADGRSGDPDDRQVIDEGPAGPSGRTLARTIEGKKPAAWQDK